MPLFCRGCSDAVNKEIRNPLQDFPRTNKSKLFETLISQGMERFCLGCRRSGRLKNVTDNVTDVCSEDSEADKDDIENESYVQCNVCRGHLNRSSFDPEKMKHWRKHWHLGRDAICLACEAKKEIEKPKAAIKCIVCLEPKSRDQYDELMLQRWEKNRELKRTATCKNCAADLGKKTRQPKRTWEKATYLCIQNANLVMHTRTIECSESFPEILSKQSRFWKGLILSF